MNLASRRCLYSSARCACVFAFFIGCCCPNQPSRFFITPYKKKMPKLTSVTEKDVAKPYDHPQKEKKEKTTGYCTLTCVPRTVHPRKDGSLDLTTPMVSRRWLDCELKCDQGDGQKKDIWLARDIALKGKQAVNSVKQIKFFLFGLKSCDCGNKYHEINKVALDL